MARANLILLFTKCSGFWFRPFSGMFLLLSGKHPKVPPLAALPTGSSTNFHRINPEVRPFNSVAGIIDANYDKSKCQKEFSEYKECRKQEVEFSPLLTSHASTCLMHIFLLENIQHLSCSIIQNWMQSIAYRTELPHERKSLHKPSVCQPGAKFEVVASINHLQRAAMLATRQQGKPW